MKVILNRNDKLIIFYIQSILLNNSIILITKGLIFNYSFYFFVFFILTYSFNLAQVISSLKITFSVIFSIFHHNH